MIVMKWMQCALALVVAVLSLVISAHTAQACSVGWTYTAKPEPAELNFVQGQNNNKGTIISLQFEKFAETECGFVAWSKMEGVSLFLTNPCSPSPCAVSPMPGVIEGVPLDSPPSETTTQEEWLVVFVDASTKAGDGIIELRQQTVDGDLTSGTVIGTVKIHIKAPSPPGLCPLIPLQRFDWAFGEVPGGLLRHVRGMPTNLAQRLRQSGAQMDYRGQSSLPSTLKFALDLTNQRGSLIGSVPQQLASHELQMKLLDNRGCELGVLYMMLTVRPRPDEPLSVSTNATAKQVCGRQFSHELTVSWKLSGVAASTTVKLEITGPDGKVQTLGTPLLEDSRTFTLAYPGGGSATIKVTAQDTGGSSSSAQSSVQLGKC